MVSTSIERSFLPSFMTEPLPNWRSIWESAADRALVLSIEDPSTIRRAVVGAAIGGAPYDGDSLEGQTRQQLCQHLGEQCTLFVLGSQYVLLEEKVLACFDHRWPNLNYALAYFDFGRSWLG